MSESVTLQPIGVIRSPCREKFAIPRQASLVPALVAQVVIDPEFARMEAFAQLSEFSHIWVISVFHQAIRTEWQPTVRPPRLGGNKRVGVFASRSPFRPNPLGLSLVALQRIEQQGDHVVLHIQGCDLVDGTPIVDIKPYLPYADQCNEATAGYAHDAPVASLPVQFTALAQQQCEQYAQQGYAMLSTLITQLLQQDPRPAYATDESGQRYAFRLYEFDVVFRVEAAQAMVDEVRPI